MLPTINADTLTTVHKPTGASIQSKSLASTAEGSAVIFRGATNSLISSLQTDAAGPARAGTPGPSIVGRKLNNVVTVNLKPAEDKGKRVCD